MFIEKLTQNRWDLKCRALDVRLVNCKRARKSKNDKDCLAQFDQTECEKLIFREFCCSFRARHSNLQILLKKVQMHISLNFAPI